MENSGDKKCMKFKLVRTLSIEKEVNEYFSPNNEIEDD